MRSIHLLSSTSRVVAAAISFALLSMAACATSSEKDGAESDGGALSVPEAGSTIEDGDAAPAAELPPCAAGVLCRVPTPLTVGYVASLTGRAKSDVWASGTGGVMMRWDGQAWTKLESQINETLTGLVLTQDEIWGVGGTLVVRRGVALDSVRTLRTGEWIRAVSGVAILPSGESYLSYSFTPLQFIDRSSMVLGKIVDFDTRKLEFEPNPLIPGTDKSPNFNARAMSIVPGKALWIVGDNGMIARYPISPLGAGALLTTEYHADLRALWAHGDQLWTAGSGGTILHFDGSTWSSEDTGVDVTLNAIFGFAADDLWAAGNDATLLHFDGTRWSPVAMGGYRGHLRAIWGSSPDDVWIGGERGMFHWGALQ